MGNIWYCLPFNVICAHRLSASASVCQLLDLAFMQTQCRQTSLATVATVNGLLSAFTSSYACIWLNLPFISILQRVVTFRKFPRPPPPPQQRLYYPALAPV